MVGGMETPSSFSRHFIKVAAGGFDGTQFVTGVRSAHITFVYMGRLC